jgi:GNAT superfamily N-acetyltransferase
MQRTQRTETHDMDTQDSTRGPDHFERRNGDYLISTDPRRIDAHAIQAYLARSYWAESIPMEIVEKAIAGSLGFALCKDDRQIGFARVVTDRATFAYLCDVYVLEEHRGRGLAKWLIQTVCAHPELQRLRRFVLITRDAHKLYEGCGFRTLQNPGGYMEIVRRDVYRPSRG